MITPIDIFLLALVALALWKVDRLEKIVKGGPIAPEASSLVIYTIIDGKETRIKDMGNLKVTQAVPLIVKAFDKKGNPAEVEGLVFSTDDAALSTVQDIGGVMHLVPTGPMGLTKLSADADGIVGEGEKPLHFEEAVNLIAGDADTLSIEFGAPIDLP